MRPILLAVLLSGCGADFTGTWSGALTQKVSCSDNTGGSRELEAKWVVVETRTEIIISPGGTCGDFTAKTSGLMSATVQQKDCGSTTRQGLRYVESITGGELEMGESLNLIGVELNEGAVIYEGNVYFGRCTSTTTGRLLKN